MEPSVPRVGIRRGLLCVYLLEQILFQAFRTGEGTGLSPFSEASSVGCRVGRDPKSWGSLIFPVEKNGEKTPAPTFAVFSGFLPLLSPHVYKHFRWLRITLSCKATVIKPAWYSHKKQAHRSREQNRKPRRGSNVGGHLAPNCKPIRSRVVGTRLYNQLRPLSAWLTLSGLTVRHTCFWCSAPFMIRFTFLSHLCAEGLSVGRF